MNHHEYLRELRQRLTFRAVDKRRADELVAEVESHLADSGEDPLESFGPPDRYAARLVRGRWPTARFLAGIIPALGAGLMAGATAAAVTEGAAMVRVSGDVVMFAVPILLTITVVNLPAVRSRLPGRPALLLLAVGVAVLAACGAAVLGPSTGWSDQDLLTLSRTGALAVMVGLVVLAAASLAGPRLARRLRRA